MLLRIARTIFQHVHARIHDVRSYYACLPKFFPCIFHFIPFIYIVRTHARAPSADTNCMLCHGGVDKVCVHAVHMHLSGANERRRSDDRRLSVHSFVSEHIVVVVCEVKSMVQSNRITQLIPYFMI